MYAKIDETIQETQFQNHNNNMTSKINSINHYNMGYDYGEITTIKAHGKLIKIADESERPTKGLKLDHEDNSEEDI